MVKKEDFDGLKNDVSKKKKILKEITSLKKGFREADVGEKRMISAQISLLKSHLKKTNEKSSRTIGKMSLAKPLHPQEEIIKETPLEKPLEKKKTKKIKISREEIKSLGLEKETLKRLRKKEKKVVEKKEKKPSKYVEISNKIFSEFSLSLLKKGRFRTLKRDLIKANLRFLPVSYISVIFFTILLSAIVAVFAFIFFLFFNIGTELPIITTATEGFGQRLLMVFWILLVVPVGTFLIMYLYPSMEKKSAEGKINQELPFATIHMSAISGSMIDPSKIFSIIISTKEYPYIGKEFTKLINEINVYGYDLVSALRRSSFNSPSRKLAELFNGLATAITSGGKLPEFFDKRAQSLLFEYRLEKEKYTKTAETFMDIYISVVIAAPMILMLLLMMIKISGLGISLSMGMITLLVVLGVAMINVIFLTFLHLKQPGG